MTPTTPSPEAAASKLQEEDRAAWLEYVALERDGVRREANAALIDFVERLSAYSSAAQRRFVEALLDGVQQRGDRPFTIRHPLWNQYVFPVLLERWDRAGPGSARALLSFNSQIHGGGECAAAIGDRDLSEIALVERALEQEPDAADLKLRWLKAFEYRFEFAIHEVPYGILWGEGATLPDHQRAVRTLDRFEAYTADVGLTARYAEDLAEWRYYFVSYCGYLESGEGYVSFSEYLAAHPMEEV